MLHSVHSVSLVAWVNPAPELLLGRRVKIRQGKILALVAANSNMESFVDTPSKRVHVLVPSIGEFAHRQPFKDAPQVPPLFSRLKLMWELSMGPASKSVAACVACEQHNDEDPVDCPLCLAAWHPTCCDTVLAGSSAQLDVTKLSFTFTANDLPHNFQDHPGLCTLCRTWLLTSSGSGGAAQGSHRQKYTCACLLKFRTTD